MLEKRNTQHLPRNEIFTAYFEQKFFYWYRKLFSIEEIENSFVIQAVFVASLFSFFITFNSWVHSKAITVESFIKGTHACWPYFQDCGKWYFLSALPDGYSQTTLYMFFFGLMLLIIFLVWKKDWVLAHIFLAILFLWKFLVMFILSEGLAGNYDYYHIILTFVLLFLPLKLFFLKLIFVLLYFLAATIKIHEGWVLGTYFSSLKTGLPFFHDLFIPPVTNLVIFMQIVGAWFLLSDNKFLQRAALVYFVLFHLYSGILVEYRYPATVLPTLLILFGPLYTHTPIPLSKKSLAGWILVGFLIIFQFISAVIPGDVKMTLEGNKYGFYMFEANHQCISTTSIYKKDGSLVTNKIENALARHRCDPYDRWFAIQQTCQRSQEVERIKWRFDHSINGGPFYRIVDEKNVCFLSYKPFSHNSWIKTPPKAPIIGYPVQNVYY